LLPTSFLKQIELYNVTWNGNLAISRSSTRDISSFPRPFYRAKWKRDRCGRGRRQGAGSSSANTSISGVKRAMPCEGGVADNFSSIDNVTREKEEEEESANEKAKLLSSVAAAAAAAVVRCCCSYFILAVEWRVRTGRDGGVRSEVCEDGGALRSLASLRKIVGLFSLKMDWKEAQIEGS